MLKGILLTFNVMTAYLAFVSSMRETLRRALKPCPVHLSIYIYRDVLKLANVLLGNPGKLRLLHLLAAMFEGIMAARLSTLYTGMF